MGRGQNTISSEAPAPSRRGAASSAVTHPDIDNAEEYIGRSVEWSGKWAKAHKKPSSILSLTNEALHRNAKIIGADGGMFRVMVDDRNPDYEEYYYAEDLALV